MLHSFVPNMQSFSRKTSSGRRSLSPLQKDVADRSSRAWLSFEDLVDYCPLVILNFFPVRYADSVNKNDYLYSTREAQEKSEGMPLKRRSYLMRFDYILISSNFFSHTHSHTYAYSCRMLAICRRRLTCTNS